MAMSADCMVSSASTLSERKSTCMVSSSCMGEGLKKESEVDMGSLLEEEVCCLSGEHGGESGYSGDSLSSES